MKMTVGDVSITAANLPAGATLQVQVATKCRVIPGIAAPNALGHAGISEDGSTFYTFMAVGWILYGYSSATSVGNNLILLPAGYYIQITNTDTAAHDTGIISVEY